MVCDDVSIKVILDNFFRLLLTVSVSDSLQSSDATNIKFNENMNYIISLKKKIYFLNFIEAILTSTKNARVILKTPEITRPKEYVCV